MTKTNFRIHKYKFVWKRGPVDSLLFGIKDCSMFKTWNHWTKAFDKSNGTYCSRLKSCSVSFKRYTYMSVGNSYSRWNIAYILIQKQNIWNNFILCYHFSINTIISILGQVENCKPGYYKDKVGYGQCLKHKE